MYCGFFCHNVWTALITRAALRHFFLCGPEDVASFNRLR